MPASETNDLKPLLPPFGRGPGLSWRANLAPSFAEPSDTNREPVVSRIQLFENGVPLGPAHTTHADIESKGQGRYSHWGGGLWFSTSDGSDPNVNGRMYAVRLSEPLLKVLGFGSCHIHGSLAALDARGTAQSLWKDARVSYSPRETRQVIEFELGRLAMPDTLHAFIISTEPASTSLAAVFDDADVIFLEFGSAIDVVYRSFCITRTQLTYGVLSPLGALGRAEGRVAKRWYHQGLIKQNEAVRSECAEQLIELLPRAGLDPVVTGDIVKHARGARQEDDAIAQTIGEIRATLGAKPICVLSTQNLFTPDGRPVTWPGNFPKQLEPICRRLGLPLLHSSHLVAEKGMAFSLESDLHHFTPQFLSYLGDQLLALGRKQLLTQTPRRAAYAPACNSLLR